ncbi:CDP-glycerol glycerophosphotransferase family protein [Actinomadura geliboluensis]|uniref:CDP-glycerol glycerophosphotransferase family protein n=1 Tax=Actinomadura geliboluensis TaxID=882440 RepID=UPI003B96831E
MITNHCLPGWYMKREGQTYVQTWHGTPLKRIGHDLKDVPYRCGLGHRRSPMSQ